MFSSLGALSITRTTFRGAKGDIEVFKDNFALPRADGVPSSFTTLSLRSAAIGLRAVDDSALGYTEILGRHHVKIS
jgi:hypothetical protein